MKSLSVYSQRSMLLGLALLMFCQSASAASVELSLNDSIALAFKNNPVVQIAEANKDKSTWAVRAAQAGKGITIDYTHSDMRSSAPPTGTGSLAAVSPYNYFSNKISASIPLYTGGRLESAIAQAKLGLKVSELDTHAVKQQLRLDTTIGYFNVLQSVNMLEIARQTERDFAAHLKRVQEMYDTGVVARHDVLQTKVKLANAENNLVIAQNQYNLAVYSLNKTIGLPLRGEIKTKELLTYQKYAFDLGDITLYGLTHRPEMAQQQANIKIAEKQVNIAQGDKRPTIILTGINSWDDQDFAGTKNRDWTAMLVTQFNVFDSGNTDAKVNQAKASVIAAREQARQTKDNISLEISDAYLSLREAEKRIDTNNVAVEEAIANFDIAKDRYSAGVGTNLDVMDAELALSQAKTNYIQSLYDYNTSKARLDKAMGLDETIAN